MSKDGQHPSICRGLKPGPSSASPRRSTTLSTSVRTGARKQRRAHDGQFHRNHKTPQSYRTLPTRTLPCVADKTQPSHPSPSSLPSTPLPPHPPAHCLPRLAGPATLQRPKPRKPPAPIRGKDLTKTRRASHPGPQGVAGRSRQNRNGQPPADPIGASHACPTAVSGVALSFPSPRALQLGFTPPADGKTSRDGNSFGFQTIEPGKLGVGPPSMASTPHADSPQHMAPAHAGSMQPHRDWPKGRTGSARAIPDGPPPGDLPCRARR